MKKRSLAFLSLLVAGSLMMSACKKVDMAGSNEPGKKNDLSQNTTKLIAATDKTIVPQVAKDRKDTVIIGITAPKGVFNPVYGETAFDMYVNEIIFEQMLVVDKVGKPAANLAELPTIKDGKVYTFKLNKNAKFSDGQPVTAEDVAFTFTVMADKSYTGPTDIVSMNLKGVQDYKDGKADKVSGIRVVDTHTIEFTLDQPNARAIYVLGTVGIMPKHYYGKDYKQGDTKSIEALHEKPLGAGPYKFVHHKKGEEVMFVANENYWRGAPKVKNVIYKVTPTATKIQQLSSGATDMDMPTVNNDNISQVQAAKFLDIQLFPTNGYGYIAFNMNLDKYKDKRVRQALVYGLDRAQIVQALYQENGNTLDIPQSRVSWAYTDDIVKYNFDQKKAAELLDAAGWKLNSAGKREKNGEQLKITFSPLQQNEGSFNDAIVSTIRRDWPKLGIDVNIDVVDFNVMTERRKTGNFDTFFMAWGLTADPDPTNVFATGGSQNNTFYSNAKVDELAKKGLAETDMTKRAAIYKDLYKEINDDLPYIFLYQRSDMWVINSRIKGFDLSPYKRFTYDMWKIEIAN